DGEAAAPNAHDLSKLFEVENIVKCATLSATASAERRESRWGNAHQRTDFPETDNANWLCHVDLRRGGGGEILASKRALDRRIPAGGER
ncbi:MAG TPA: fumarate reductase/succinate dehydrogenase flavoprotein subunit, partial [Thermodesulfobacteriota bacterium]|nr:fumarate reductase/succinate dehydrogenase flavoprotein subunit [Thermodesulfobacteriota bacterium]